jgi:anti-sigma factor RsiW
MTCDEVRPLLNARLDNELDRTPSADLDSHISTCPSCGGELERLTSIQRAIRGGMRYNRAPEGLRDQVRFALRGAVLLDRRAPAPRWRMWGSVAAAVIVCALVSAPFIVNERNQRSMVAEEFLSAHVRALMGRDVDVVSSDNHTVKPWFNGKLPFSPPVVDLAPQGFPLEGARLDSIGGNRVAVLVYRRRLHRIDVFVRPSSSDKAPSRFERNGFTGLSWTKGSFLFTAVSDLNSAELKTFTELMISK